MSNQELGQDQFFTRLSTRAKNALIEAHKKAEIFKHPRVGSEHMLYGIMTQKGSIGFDILTHNKLTTQKLHQGIISSHQHRPIRGRRKKASNPQEIIDVEFSENAKGALEKAFIIALQNKHAYVGTEHLVAGILSNQDNRACEILRSVRISRTKILKQIDGVLNSTSKFHEMQLPGAEESDDVENGHSHSHDDMPEHPFMGGEIRLEDLGIDLSEEEIAKTIDPVIGREKEIDRVVAILNRRNKNNPILLGEPGVGKTAIVEGLAKRIAEGDVPDSLQDKRIFQLDMASLVAGTMYRGEFEERIKKILDEAKADPSLILFIDEIHNIIGAGSTPGSLDAANIIKPALARGEIRCIGATTLTEFKQHIEKDPALERRFQRVMVAEPSIEDTKTILRGLRANYEDYHRLTITDEAIVEAVELSDRYVNDRFLPDKAVDVIDEAAARLKANRKGKSYLKSIRELQKKLSTIKEKKTEAVEKEKFSRATAYKERENEIKAEIKKLRAKDKKSKSRKSGKITTKEVRQVISETANVNIEHLATDQRATLANLEQELGKHIIGQDQALKAIAQTIRRHRTGISNPDRPIGTFLFLGPTGVGKTELAKVLASTVYRSPDALIRVDMSEFSERFNISKLIGAPAGYVGYDEGGTLTEKIRKRPYSVVLFDEIEKAHRDVHNLLLQILDDGMITDASGRQISFKNTIIILTSNAGSRQIGRKSSIGFEQLTDSSEWGNLRANVNKELKAIFSPEFLSRLDSTIIFKPLGHKQAQKIVELQLAELRDRLKKQDINLRVQSSAKSLISQKGLTKEQGARLIRNIIQNQVEDEIAKLLLESSTRKKTITLKAQNGKVIAT